ncbi:hypothetical protein ES703_101677 [subsurface metagenome]
MERTEVYTVAATAAKVPVISDKAQLVVPKGAGRANLNTGGISAVHTGSTAKKPVYFSFPFHFPELDLEPGFRSEVGGVLVATLISRPNSFIPIPLLAGHLTGTASGAQRWVI